MAETVGGTLIRRHEAAIALGIAGAFLAVAALAPLVTLVGGSIDALAILAEPRIWELLARSIGISLAVTLASVAMGVPLGLLFGRMDVMGARAAWLLHAFAMFLPPLLPALGWFHLLRGKLLFSPIGLIGVLTLNFTPIVTSLVALGVLGVDASLEEAARTCARPWRVVTRILLPASWPALALAVIMVFALSISELGAPMFLRVDVFPAAVFARLGGVDYAPGEAIALVLPLMLVALALLAIERRLIGPSAVVGLRSRMRPPLPLGRWRIPATIACWLVALLSVAPLYMLGARADVGEALAWARDAPVNGLMTAAASATLIVLLGVVIGHALARARRGAALLDTLAVLAFVTPASVLGVGLIALWNRGTTQIVYRTLAILVIGFVARYAVVGVRVVAAAVAQMPCAYEEAAAAAGATYSRRLRHIVVPLSARGIVFAWLLAVVFCLRDLDTSVLFYPPGGEPLTVRIFTLEANGPEAVVAGLCMLQVAITGAVVILAALVFLRRRRT